MKLGVMGVGMLLAASVLALAAPSAAEAQELNLAHLDETSNVVHVRTGAEYGFVAGVGYGRVVPLAWLERRIVLTVDATLPWASFDVSDYRVRAGATVPILDGRRWKLAGALAPTVRGTKNTISRMTDVGADLALVGGWYGRRAFAAAEAGFDWALATRVVHDQAYRDHVFADARDGWYRNPGGNVRGGLQGGLSFGGYDVVLRAGVVRDTRGGEPVLPFYGTLAVNARW